MADYYTNFSLVLKLANEAEQAYALDLAHKVNLAKQGDELPADFPKALVDVIEDWQFETDTDSSGTNHGLWLHSMYGGVDAVCSFIQHLLQKFDPQGHVSFEWSHDCSKPRVDAYGGGAAFITAKEIKTMNTAAWLNEQTEKNRLGCVNKKGVSKPLRRLWLPGTKRKQCRHNLPPTPPRLKLTVGAENTEALPCEARTVKRAHSIGWHFAQSLR